jgi:hypothetical protein
MRVLREPLVHFLLIGVGLFWLYSFIQPAVDDDSNRVIVTTSQTDQFVAQFTRTRMRPPTETEVNGLVQTYIRDEVYYREAIALGLDQNDGLIRQRMRQKLEFILEELTTGEPDEATLSLFLKQHPEKFRQQSQTSFQQVYLSFDKRQDLAEDASIMLQNIRAGAASETLSDPTMLPYAYQLLTKSEIARQLGEVFAREIETIAPGDWVGPVYSGFGGHLVKVMERVPGRLPELAEVRAEVKHEYLTLHRQQQKDKAYQKMLDAYEIVIEPISVGNTVEKASVPFQTKGAS